MSDIDDGGPAFPRDELNDDGSMFVQHRGMSVRDWLAGQALSGLLTMRKDRFNPEDDARYCYMVADAMLAARKKEPKP